MKKNILVIHHVYPIGQNIGDKIRTLNMIKSLHDIGFNVYFLAFFTKGLTRLGTEKKTYKAPSKKVFYIYSLPNRVRLNKIAAFLRSSVVWFICRLYKIDVIQAELAHGTSCVKFVPNIPVVTDFHSDLVPELMMRNFSRYNLRYAAEDNKYALLRSISTITVSHNLYLNLLKYQNVTKANYILPCNFDSFYFQNINLKIRNNLRAQYSLEDRIVLCYSGGLYVWQCVDETINIVKLLLQKNPRYYFCLYTCDDTTRITEMLKPIEGNYMIKSLNKNEVPTYLSIIDVGFVLRDNNLVNINSSPTKTAEYFAAGAMVVATQFSGDAPELISQSGNGVVLKSLNYSDQDIEYLNEQINMYVNNYEINSKSIKNYIFKNRAWTYNEQQLIEVYKGINMLDV